MERRFGGTFSREVGSEEGHVAQGDWGDGREPSTEEGGHGAEVGECEEKYSKAVHRVHPSVRSEETQSM